MHFTVLGGVEAQDADGPLVVGGPVQHRLLGMLLVHANHSVSNDRLLEVLFDGEAPDGALHALRTYVSRLRSALGDGVVETTPGGYRLVIADPEDIDAARFERMVSGASVAGADGDPGARRRARRGRARGVAGTSVPAVLRRDVGACSGRSPRGAVVVRSRATRRVAARARRPPRGRGRGRAPRTRGAAPGTSSRRVDAGAVQVRPAGGGIARVRGLSRVPRRRDRAPTFGVDHGARTANRRGRSLARRGRSHSRDPRLPVAREAGGGRVRRGVPRCAGRRRARSRSEDREARPSRRSCVHRAVRGGGSARRPVRAPSHRPALRLLARAGRRVPR